MELRNSSIEYGTISKFFHWSIAILIIGMIFLGFFMGNATSYAVHKSIGLTILLLAALRLLWRLFNPPPYLPNTVPDWQKAAAHLSHYLLYFLLFAMPLSGWIMSTAAGHPPSFWWSVTVPTPWVPISKNIAGIANQTHEILAWTLSALIALHTAAALKHHFIDKDNVVNSMKPCGKIPK